MKEHVQNCIFSYWSSKPLVPKFQMCITILCPDVNFTYIKWNGRHWLFTPVYFTCLETRKCVYVYRIDENNFVQVSITSPPLPILQWYLLTEEELHTFILYLAKSFLFVIFSKSVYYRYSKHSRCLLACLSITNLCSQLELTTDM